MDKKTLSDSSLFSNTIARIAAALLLCAAFAATNTGCGSDDDEAAKAEPAKPVDPGVEAALKILEQHQAAINPPARPHIEGQEVDGVLGAAIERSEELKDLRRQIHKMVGPCQMVCNGFITPLGKAVLERLDQLEDHGLNPKLYEIGFLKSQTESWYSKVNLSESRSAKGAQKAVFDLLESPIWNKDVATRTLEAAGGMPTQADIDAIVPKLKAASAEAANHKDTAAGLEVALTQALLQIVLDFKFLKYVGPFETVPRKTRKNKNRRLRHITKFEKQVLPALKEIYQAPDKVAALKALEPDDSQYEPMLKAYKRYRDLAAKGCPVLPDKWVFTKGTRPSPEVGKLQERLKCEGYFNHSPDDIYGTTTIEAVKQYQRDHAMEPTGWADAKTMRSINVSMERRAETIRLNLHRIRERPTGHLGDFYIRVNLPAFEMSVLQDDNVIRKQRVIIGTNKLDDDKHKLIQGHINRTPLLTTELYNIHVNPSWILPSRVYKGELVGAMKKNPNYMKENNIEKIERGGKTIYIQGPGEFNVLGKVKFMLTESKAIFLHDTNDPWLFKKDHRTFSHGCIRVDEAPKFARWLLERDGQDMVEVDKAYKAEHKQWGFPLEKPIPLMTVYRTAEINESGRVVFFADPYKYDRAALRFELPVVERVRWGSGDLRPHWVPQVPKKTVDEWRRQGKPAPRDLKPKKDDGKKKKKKK